jgi:hypothetical protein
MVTILLPKTQRVSDLQPDGTSVTRFIIRNVVYPELLSSTTGRVVAAAPVRLPAVYPALPTPNEGEESWSGAVVRVLDADDTVRAATGVSTEVQPARGNTDDTARGQPAATHATHDDADHAGCDMDPEL